VNGLHLYDFFRGHFLLSCVVGSTLELLLNFEVTADANKPTPIQIFSERLHQSKTIHCDLTYPSPYAELCTDIGLVYVKEDRQEHRIVKFVFENDNYRLNFDEPGLLLGFDGIFKLSKNTSYELTSTHFCFGDIEEKKHKRPANNGMVMQIETDGSFSANANVLSRVAPDSPAASAVQRCWYNQSVNVFPYEATIEQQSWLKLDSRSLYESSSSALEERRTAVEIGTDCALQLPELSRALRLYRIDCTQRFAFEVLYIAVALPSLALMKTPTNATRGVRRNPDATRPCQCLTDGSQRKISSWTSSSPQRSFKCTIRMHWTDCQEPFPWCGPSFFLNSRPNNPNP
jgi:hypothetical protein